MNVNVANVLAVGVTDRIDALKGLPIRLFTVDTSAEAVQCLREERIDALISRWRLVDMPQGSFLENIKAAKPAIPTIVFVVAGDRNQEIAARSLGVSAVLNEDMGDGYFRETLRQLLSVRTVQI